MSDEKKTKRKTKASSPDSGGRSGDRDVGHALRTVYAKTVSEDVPAELLDLLGKLS